MYAYAISNGEGTLIDYGIASYHTIREILNYRVVDGQALIIGPAENDPETGE